MGPSSNELAYFALQEVERGRLAAQERQTAVLDEAAAREKALHFMKCPKCGMPLEEIAISSVRVDKCPGCEGIWLDKGELQAVRAQESGFLCGLLDALRK